MKIAIISDIHDQIDNLNWTLNQIKNKDISYIFTLGDYTSSYVIERLQVDTIPIYAVWGNCDGDKQSMLQVSNNKNPYISFANKPFYEVEIDTKRIFITHYPELAENAAKTLDYDAVFHGHTHYKRNEKIGNISIINPGKLAIYPDNEISFAIFDTQNSNVEFIIK